VPLYEDELRKLDLLSVGQITNKQVVIASQKTFRISLNGISRKESQRHCALLKPSASRRRESQLFLRVLIQSLDGIMGVD
jgi:hypothetical protein